LEKKPQMLLALVLLRIIEHISKDDPDQEWVDLYNSIKPLAESSLRKRQIGLKF